MGGGGGPCRCGGGGGGWLGGGGAGTLGLLGGGGGRSAGARVMDLARLVPDIRPTVKGRLEPWPKFGPAGAGLWW